MNHSNWIIRKPGAQRRFRLYCFCYAGGSAAHFMPWQDLVDPAIEICAVQLPGRGTRMNEKPCSSLTELIETLGQVIAGQGRMPFAFFGHSLGGLIAFELARYCKHFYLPMPERLFVSGCNAPQFRDPSKGLHRLPDDELIAELKDYNGTPPEILAHRELMELVLPVIRADFALVENYRYRHMPLLTTPIVVLAGKADDRSSPEQADGWARETSGSCRVDWFEGDHFFINAERDAVLECINAELAELIQA